MTNTQNMRKGTPAPALNGGSACRLRLRGGLLSCASRLSRAVGPAAGIQKAFVDGKKLVEQIFTLADNTQNLMDKENLKVSWGIGVTGSFDYARSSSAASRQTGVSLTSLGDMRLKAGQDLTLQGSQLASAADLAVTAGRDFKASAARAASEATR